MDFFIAVMRIGSRVASIVGGLIGAYLSWRWIFKYVNIINPVMLVASVFSPRNITRRNCCVNAEETGAISTNECVEAS